MSGISFTIEGDRAISRMIGLAAEALGDPTPVFEGIMRPKRAQGLAGVDIMDKRFTIEGAATDAFNQEGRNAYGGKWTGYQFEPAYERHKANRGGGGKIGIWSGSRSPLFRTFTDRSHPEHIERVDRRGFEVGSRRHYARAFHEGERVQPWDAVRTPARPIRPFDASDKFGQEVARTFGRYVVGQMGRARTEAGGVGNIRVEP